MRKNVMIQSKQRVNNKKTSIEIEGEYTYPIYIISKSLNHPHIQQLLQAFDQNKIPYQVQQETSNLGNKQNVGLFIVDNKLGQLSLGSQFFTNQVKLIMYPYNGKSKNVIYLQNPLKIIKFYQQYSRQRKNNKQNYRLNQEINRKNKISQEYQPSKIRIKSITHQQSNRASVEKTKMRCKLYIIKNNDNKKYIKYCNQIKNKLQSAQVIKQLQEFYGMRIKQQSSCVYFLVYYQDVINLLKLVKVGKLIVCDFGKQSAHSQYFKQKRVQGIYFSQDLINQAFQKLKINAYNLIPRVVDSQHVVQLNKDINNQNNVCVQHQQGNKQIQIPSQLVSYKTGCFKQNLDQVLKQVKQYTQQLKRQKQPNNKQIQIRQQSKKQVNIQQKQIKIEFQQAKIQPKQNEKKDKKIKKIINLNKKNKINNSQYFNTMNQSSSIQNHSSINQKPQQNRQKKSIIHRHQKQSATKGHIKFKQNIVQSPRQIKRIKRVKSQSKYQPQNLSNLTQSVFTQTDSSLFQSKNSKKIQRIRSITCQSAIYYIQQPISSVNIKVDAIIYRQFMSQCQKSAKMLQKALKLKHKIKSFINMEEYDRLLRTYLRKRQSESCKQPLKFAIFIEQQDYPSFGRYIQQKSQYLENKELQIQRSFTSPSFFINIDLIPPIIMHLFINSTQIYCGITPRKKITLNSHFLPFFKFSPQKAIQIIEKNNWSTDLNKYYS